MTTFVDNSGIMTYYLTKHLTPKEELEYDENERLIKEAEEAEKRRIQQEQAEYYQQQMQQQ